MIIYLACPYTSENQSISDERVSRATRAASLLMRRGFVVFSPITYGHALAKELGNHQDSLFWIKHMLPYMTICSYLYILQEDGWTTSKGIWEHEHKEAIRLNLPIRMITLETLEQFEQERLAKEKEGA